MDCFACLFSRYQENSGYKLFLPFHLYPVVWINQSFLVYILNINTTNNNLGILTLSVQFSRSVMSNSLWSHGLQHTRPPCLSPTPRVYSNACQLSWWCNPTISSSVIPFSSRLQSFPASGSLQMSQFFASGGQSVGVSATASVLPMNIQDWFLLGLSGFDLLAVQGTLESSPTPQFKRINS